MNTHTTLIRDHVGRCLRTAGCALCADFCARVRLASQTARRRRKAAGPEPFAGSTAAVQAGHRLFMANNCYGCHSPGGGGGMGPPLIDAKWKHGDKPRDIYKSIAEGHPDHGMPPFGKRLREKEIWQLVTYVESLGGGK